MIGSAPPPDLNLGVGFGVRLGGGVEYFFCAGVCAFLLGVFEKSGVLTWCFGGEVVVFCVVDVVFWQSLFRSPKK
ncbi:hypothetical protein RBB78_08395 [Tunturiibacter empetritectus]|uniref:hypothetical protein n=1 Tax=Tunturiibacter empetritectus TaxID=3069691 RepID=UPI003D9AD4B7